MFRFYFLTIKTIKICFIYANNATIKVKQNIKFNPPSIIVSSFLKAPTNRTIKMFTFLGANIFFTDLKEQRENCKMTERAKKGIFM